MRKYKIFGKNASTGWVSPTVFILRLLLVSGTVHCGYKSRAATINYMCSTLLCRANLDVKMSLLHTISAITMN